MDANDGIDNAITAGAGVDLQQILQDNRYAKYARLVFAALGSIPWVGGLLGAAAALHAEREQGTVNQTTTRWLQEHERQVDDLRRTLGDMIVRLEQLGDFAEGRLEDEAYLALIRKGFRVWDQAESSEKRELVRKTLINAGGTRLCSDDVVRLFLDWIGQYHEIHFRVIRAIYSQPGATRGRIWEDIGGLNVREDSAEADIFKLLIRDLSTGGVIRQHRDTTHDGEFISRAGARRRRQHTSHVLESAFEDTKSYVLTELGKQFVHYAMEEVVPRIGNDRDSTS